jgi:hypothetical protein
MRIGSRASTAAVAVLMMASLAVGTLLTAIVLAIFLNGLVRGDGALTAVMGAFRQTGLRRHSVGSFTEKGKNCLRELSFCPGA